MVSFNRIKKLQMKYYRIHKKLLLKNRYEPIQVEFTEDDIKEMIYILGQLLYFMIMTNRKEI